MRFSIVALWLSQAGLAAEKPLCGLLTPTKARDHDSLCVHVMHKIPWLGDLELDNSSCVGTAYSPLPARISHNEGAWIQLRDGVYWLATGGGKHGARLEPFVFKAVYRGRCTHGCSPGTTAWVVIRVSLRSHGYPSGRLEGEHSVEVSIAGMGGALHDLRPNVSWVACMLEATVNLDGKPVTPAGSNLTATNGREVGGSASLATSRATRPVHPEDRRDWCSHLTDALQAALVEQSSHLHDGNAAVDVKVGLSVCSEMAAARAVNSVHIEYFHKQQQAQVDLLNAAEHELCAGSPDEATYQHRLHTMLEPYRMANHLHIHMAFMAKSVCASNGGLDRQRATASLQGDFDVLALPTYAGGYFHLHKTPDQWLAERNLTSDALISKDDVPGWDSWLQLFHPYTHNADEAADAGWFRASAINNVDPTFLPDQPDPDADFCPLPILHHEPFNTWESWFVWNVTAHLLKAGSQFCEQPAGDRTALFDMWRPALDEVMVNHRSNNAFIVYCACRHRKHLGAAPLPRTANGVYATVSVAGALCVAGKTYEVPCRLSKMAERPELSLERIAQITANDVARRAEYYEDKYRATLEAMRAEKECNTAGVTADDLIAAIDNDTAIVLAMAKGLLHQPVCKGLHPDHVVRLGSEIGPLPAERRYQARDQFSNAWASWAVTLGSAYHKITPICEPADALYARFDEYDWVCDHPTLPTEPDGKMVYDLTPADPSRGYCYGESCRLAVEAVDEFRAFMHHFSRFRKDVVHAMLSTHCPFEAASGRDGFLELLLRLRGWLPALIQKLRRGQAGLVATCVSPTRTPPVVQAENWEKAVDLMAEELEMRRQEDPSTPDRIRILVPPKRHALDWARPRAAAHHHSHSSSSHHSSSTSAVPASLPTASRPTPSTASPSDLLVLQHHPPRSSMPPSQSYNSSV